MGSTTSIGGDRRDMPPTSWTLIVQAGGQGAEARRCLEQLVGIYWKPVYWYVRGRWRRSNEDAKDLVQEFFAAFVERGMLEGMREQVRFRAYLRGCLEKFLLQERRDGARQKRGGGAPVVSLDPDACDLDLPARDEPPELAFDRAWARTLMDDCVKEVERLYSTTRRETYWRVFERHHLSAEPTTYEETAALLGLSVPDVQNRLRHARRALRDLVRERVKDTLSDPADLEDELALLRRLAT
jgi:RNA polymerase sigma factor (sigma-70 family)